MQAITTKYIGPTNFRGARVAASAQAGRVVLDWDHAKNPDGNHAAAARALANKYGWEGRLVGGDLPAAASHHMAFVFVNAFSVEA